MHIPYHVKELSDKMLKENRKFFRRIKARPPADLDKTVIALDDEVFKKINCLDCANCCKTISPIIKPKDIERIAKTLKLRPSDVVERYLRIDEDGDYVVNAAPCPFLGADNYCSIYESRPNACRDYPHTNRRKFHQALKVTEKNVAVCPAVFEIVERLKKIY